MLYLVQSAMSGYSPDEQIEVNRGDLPETINDLTHQYAVEGFRVLRKKTAFKHLNRTRTAAILCSAAGIVRITVTPIQ